MAKSKKNESFSMNRISKQLEYLKWETDGDSRNVLFNGECATKGQKESLKGKRPDFILYKKGTTIPVAIIEAKRPNTTLDDALKQGCEYAKKLGVNVVFASDSYLVKTCCADGSRLQLDGVRINDFVSENLLLKLAEHPDLDTDKKIQINRSGLIKIFKSAEKLLSENGIDADVDRVYEFCVTLFVKILSDKYGDGKWQSLCASRDDEIVDEYRKIIDGYKEKYKGIFREIKITKPIVLQKIIDNLEQVDLQNVDIDIKGDAYEYFLERYSKDKKSELGQHFTPRHITDMMTVLLNPEVGEKIYDPFCGTGGMLISCYKWMRKNITNSQELKVLNKDTLYGQDINASTIQIAKMNMIIVEDGNTNIQNGDSIETPQNKKYHKIITNIPFNLPSRADAGSHYKVPFTNTNALCVIHCLHAAAVGGSACIIVPENMCYDDKYSEERKHILEMAKLHCVIRLPRATFKSYTNARACILHFTDIGKSKTTEYAYVDIKHDGYSDSTWREPIEENDIPHFVENRNNLSDKFKTMSPGAKNYEIIPKPTQFDYLGPCWQLRELVDVKPKEKLVRKKKYWQPKLCSHTNTIRRSGVARSGRVIKESHKVLIKPGDLVIATLHTQSGNGLFAFSDSDYFATSQLVLVVKRDIVDEFYLTSVLRHALPKLEVDDLVGRETFKIEDILNIKIPKPPESFQGAEYEKLIGQYTECKRQLNEMVKEEISPLFKGDNKAEAQKK